MEGGGGGGVEVGVRSVLAAQTLSGRLGGPWRGLGTGGS